jgi:oligogalacturonide lyase
MNLRVRALACLLCVLTSGSAPLSDDPPSDWIDSDTGHRVIRISAEGGSQTLYFHDNSYSTEGDKYVFSSPSGIMLLDLTTLGKQPPKPELIVPGGAGAYMARRTREVYFTRRGAANGGVFAYNIDTKTTRAVPHAVRTLINADETITVATIAAEDSSG